MTQPSTKCPHCKTGTLAPTKESKKDSDQKDVRVFKCDECPYTEGRE